MNRWFVLLFLILFFGHISYAQYPSWSTVKLAESVQINHLQKDTLGFLWALAHDGLYKYDGYDLNQVLIPDNGEQRFLSLTVEDNFQFIIGTENGIIISFDPYSEAFSRVQNDNFNYPITSLDCPDINRNYLLISYGNGILWRTDGVDTILSTNEILVSNEVYAGISNNQSIYLATDQGIQILEKIDNTIQSSLLNTADGLSDIIITNIRKTDDVLWINDFDRAISKIDLETMAIQNYQFHDASRINDLLVQEDGSIIVSRDDGVYFLQEDKLVKKYPINGSAHVSCIEIDEEDNLWLFDPREGLIKGSLLFQKLELPVTQIQAVLKIKDDFWIGNSTGLRVFNNIGQARKLLNKNITSIARFDKRIWVGTFSDGIYIFDLQERLIQNITSWNGFYNQSVLYILPDSDQVHISALTGVVSFDYLIKSDGKIELEKPNSYYNIIGPSYVYQILKKDNTTYFATDRQGVKMVNQDQFQHYNTFEDGSKIGSVYSMAIDSRNVLWFSSSEGGLGYVKDGKVAKLQSAIGNDDYYTSLVNMSDGNMLLVRSSSVDILNPLENHLMYFDSELGISQEPPYLNTFSSMNGEVWFAHDHQLYQYHIPNYLKIHPEIKIDKILVNLSNAQNQNSFLQDENNIQFHFTGSWLTNPDKLSYQYKLEGLDEEWRTTLDRTVSYPKLNSGNYTFRVRASENMEFKDEPEASFTFTIDRYFYNTWWFWALLVFVGTVGLIQYLDQRKQRQLRQSEIDTKHVESQLLNLKNQLNPHFLFNSFNTLMGLIEEDKDRSIKFTEKLTDFYRLVLEHGKNQLVPFEEEIKLIKLYVDILNERFGNALEMKITKESIQSLIPPLTLQLLVENVTKHNEIRSDKKLIIELYIDIDFICVKNKKSPKQYPAPSSRSGLQNIQKRYLLLNATPIQIIEDQNTFEVRLPIIPVKTSLEANSNN